MHKFHITARLGFVLLFLAGCSSVGVSLPTQTAAPLAAAPLATAPLPSQTTTIPGGFATEPPIASLTAMPTDTPTGDPAETAIPTCTSPAALTPALTEGPYYTPGSPERASLLEDGLTGTVLVLSGYVLTPDCQPVGHAWLDFWQADANGVYDNSGYILRGHQYADENGYYQLTTVVPGIYTGRTEHIHFKVQAPEGPILTSQLFFPGIAQNDQDGIFDPALVITITGQAGDTIEATINIILNP